MTGTPRCPDWSRVGARPDATGALVGTKPGLRWRGQRGILGPQRAWRNGRRARLRIWSRKGWRFKSSRAHQSFCQISIQMSQDGTAVSPTKRGSFSVLAWSKACSEHGMVLLNTAMLHQIRCVRRGDGAQPHERISHVGGGSGARSWLITVQQAIKGIEDGSWLLCVLKEDR